METSTITLDLEAAAIVRALKSVVAELSDENYAKSFAFYRVWFDIGQAYHNMTSDLIFRDIWNNKGGGSAGNPTSALTHSNARLIVRFASDVESDRILSPHGTGLQNRLCRESLREFFGDNMGIASRIGRSQGPHAIKLLHEFYVHTDLVAHWANLGYVEETTIRDRILQSLISHPTLYEHQANALLTLFKLAGATFEAYAGSSLVDRCFELLKNYCYSCKPVNVNPLEVRMLHAMKSVIRLRWVP